MSLERLLRPGSIAAIGGAQAAEVVRQCRRMGFRGELWPVHPAKAEVEGLPCFASLEALPAAPDASFIGVNREQTVVVARTLAERGAGGAVAFASGFKESGGEGVRLQAALVAAAGAMPVLGPNCYGFINYLDGALLWPDQHGGQRVERGVALVMQSSNIAINLTMSRRALPIAYVICLGNQAAVGLAEVMRTLAEDRRVSALGLYLEGLDDPGAFAAAALELFARDLPVVALRGGQSAAGAAQAVSHTASITGDGAVMSALLGRIGIAEVASLPVLLETLKLLHVHGRLPGRRVVSLSCSGGEAALIADAALGTGVSLPAFSEAERARIAATTHPLVTVSNPFDYHTFDWGRPERLRATFQAVIAADIDLAALVLDWPREDRTDPAAWRLALDAWCAAVRASGRTGALIASLPENLPEPLAAELIAAGIAPLLGIPEALQAIDAAGPPPAEGAPPRLALPPADDAPAVGLDEAAAKALLARHGLAVPAAELATDPEAACAAAERLGYPVVLKVLGVAHKSEHGAVRLNLGSRAAVSAAAGDLLRLGERLLVEAMVEDGVAELIVGTALDPAAGLHLVLGSGGLLVELVGDSAVLILPASAEKVRRTLLALRVGRLLEGHRGRARGDIEAAVEAILAIQRCVLAETDRLVEMDVNPLIVRPAGLGAVAVDALIRLRAAAE